MGPAQSRARSETSASPRPLSPSSSSSSSHSRQQTQQRGTRWSASRLDGREALHYHHRRGEYTSTVVNARAQVFGHRDSDNGHLDLVRSRAEWSFSSSSNSDGESSACSDTESESSIATAMTAATTANARRKNDPVRDNLVMLPSTLDPLGRKIRRVTTEIVDADEQLLLVKRRASAAKRIALRGYQQSVLPTTSASNGEKRQQQQQPEHEQSGDEKEETPVTPADFEYLKVIGVGAWGKVVLVRNRRDAKLYAMKVISKRAVRENNLAEKILSERDVLGGTYHHALVHLHWAFQTKTSLFLVMDYCPGGELSVHLHDAERFSEEVAVFYAAEIVLALEHLHRQGIIYRDLKPENLLLTANGHLKLVDFGISKFGITEATEGATTICGSYEYLAPEVFLNKEYGTAVDWWSFGIVIYEMLTGLPPWYSQNAQVMRKRILKKALVFPSYVSEEARDLLRRLLHRDPLKRLGSKDGSREIKRHAFFRNLDWQMVTFREIFPPIQPCGSPQSIENASNFDIEFTRLSVGSVDASGSVGNTCDEFRGFNFEAPEAPHIEYGYARDLGVQSGAGILQKTKWHLTDTWRRKWATSSQRCDGVRGVTLALDHARRRLQDVRRSVRISVPQPRTSRTSDQPVTQEYVAPIRSRVFAFPERLALALFARAASAAGAELIDQIRVVFRLPKHKYRPKALILDGLVESVVLPLAPIPDRDDRVCSASE